METEKTSLDLEKMSELSVEELTQIILEQAKKIEELTKVPVTKPTARQAIVASVIRDLVKSGKSVIEWNDLLTGCKELNFVNRNEILTIAGQQKDSAPYCGITAIFRLPKRSEI